MIITTNREIINKPANLWFDGSDIARTDEMIVQKLLTQTNHNLNTRDITEIFWLSETYLDTSMGGKKTKTWHYQTKKSTIYYCGNHQIAFRQVPGLEFLLPLTTQQMGKAFLDFLGGNTDAFGNKIKN